MSVALVAGGSRGLGLLIARELGRRGHQVVITGRSADSLDRARQLLADEGIAVRTQVHDVRDRAGASELVSQIEADLGPIETLIVAAGVIKVGPLPERAEAYDEPIDIMLRGPINLVHAVLPGMRRRDRGRIGIVTSIGGVIAVPHLVPYSVAKFGAVGFARGLTEELSGTGITVSTIIPGLIRSGGHFNAGYYGRPSQEYRWFTVMSSLPVISINADRAASLIVGGVLRGRTTIAFTPTTLIGAPLYGLLPTPFTRLLGAAGRALLPDRDERPDDHQQPGREAARGLRSPVFAVITTLARRAVKRLNQHPGQVRDRDQD